MRFLVKFILLVSVRKDIDFFAMYDEGFLIIRTNSLEGALAYLKGGAPIDAVVIEKAQDAARAANLCNAIKRSKPGVPVALIDDSDTLSDSAISADVVLDRSLTDVEFANFLSDALVGTSRDTLTTQLSASARPAAVQH